MKRLNLFDNGECRRLFAAFAVMTALFMLLAVLWSAVYMHMLQANFARREYAVAGNLIATHAARKDAVVSAFVMRGGQKYASTGAAVLRQAGYTGGTVGALLPFLPKLSALFLSVLLCVALVIWVLLAAEERRILAVIYGKLEAACTQALRISRGDYSAKLPETAEGSFARMNHAFNEMASGVRTGVEKLTRERLFLKNLISDISHQLKTPLSALKMYNEILLQEPLSEAAQSFAVKSGEQLERMEWLILGLLKMARVESGCMDMTLSEYGLKSVVQGALDDFALAAKEKQIEMVLEAQSDPLLNCDAAWLKEAFGNVIKNCVEHTPPGGKITVSIEESPVMLGVRVSDTGSGIHPDDLPYIFRRFYRGRGSRNTGSGIGLSLAKALVEQMGGALMAGGEYGRGAVFTFSFLRHVI